MRCSLAVGRERDASALARTNKTMHKHLNSELYKLVIKNRTFYIVHWAAYKGRTETLEIAFANGADPNQMWTSFDPIPRAPSAFRPAGWGLETAEKLDRAVWRRSAARDMLYHSSYFGFRTWRGVLFSSSSLSKAESADVDLLLDYYHNHLEVIAPRGQSNAVMYGHRHYYARSKAMEEVRDEAMDDILLNDLPKPLVDGFTFPENMSPTIMDREDVKLGFLRLFRYWNNPLHFAALHDKSVVVKALLANGADLDSTSVQACKCLDWLPSISGAIPNSHLVAYTALHVAICSGNYATARVLVAHGAHQMAKIFSGNDDRDWLRENPLHTALADRHGHGLDHGFIEFLLNHGYAARIEERNHENLTPLLIACDGTDETSRLAVVRLLLRHGAEIENQGPCPVFHRFFGSFFLPTGVHELATPALWAARRGKFRLAQLLLDQGADPRTKSSPTRVTMLHAVCSKVGYHRRSVKQDRTNLLDYLLANSTAKDLNSFDRAGCTPLTLLIDWKFTIGHVSGISDMESKLFRKGADIMAGIEVGKKTPFETLIEKSLTSMLDIYDIEDLGSLPSEVGNKLLATLRASRINENPHRPKAFLNRFWSYLDSEFGDLVSGSRRHARETVPILLHALIKCGFSPAEVDRHGDTAMTSFLKFLLNDDQLVLCDKKSSGANGHLIHSILALLQENGAALHVRNKEGCTAFDYLRMILDEGQGNSEFTASVVGRQVQSGLDKHGSMCLKFHPTNRIFGDLSGSNLLHTMQRDSSKWLVCEHWCRYHCGNSKLPNGQCWCARNSSQKFAKCDGQCC